MPGKRSESLSRRAILRGGGTAIGAAALGLSPFGASAANYPDRTVKIIVPFAPAGPTDIMARILSVHLSEALGVSVIVDNRAGAGGNIGMGAAARAEPDGHTLLITSSALVVNPGLYAKVPYDPSKDFEPISELGTSPNVFVANPQTGINSIADLVARAKANPDELNYASAGIGTTPHLSAELLKFASGIQMKHIPFSGAGPAIQAILAGTVQIACTALAPAHPHIQSGSLKALALTGTSPWFDLPGVPTMTGLGYKDVVADTFQAFLAPAKTPPDIIELLSAKTVAILKTPKISEQLRDDGFEVLATGPEGMRKRIAGELPKWREIVTKAGIKPV